MLRVIEFDVEAVIKFPRKTPERRIGVVDIRVADDAHGDIRGYKLPLMATYAGFVSRKTRRRRIIFALVTSSAGK
jgi:hypothetical protein